MRKTPFLLALTLGAALTLASCGPESPKQEHVAVVNGAPILFKEFKKEVSLSHERNPELVARPGSEEAFDEVLDTMILKKLMVQEAARMGLTEDEDFLDTIKMFWEQTLIRKLMDAKTGEWAGAITISDDEAATHYNRMRHRITLLAVKAENEDEAKRLKERLADGKRPSRTVVMGPLLIENVKPSDPLCTAFDLPAGGADVIRDDGGYLAVKVLKKEDVKTPPFDRISGEIKKALIERKKGEVLDMWLNGLKKSATIEINRSVLKKVEEDE